MALDPKGIGSRTGKSLVPMNLFDQGADQGFAVQDYFVFGFDLGKDFGDMEGLAGLAEYV
jgi:hypothetical protein